MIGLMVTAQQQFQLNEEMATRGRGGVTEEDDDDDDNHNNEEEQEQVLVLNDQQSPSKTPPRNFLKRRSWVSDHSLDIADIGDLCLLGGGGSGSSDNLSLGGSDGSGSGKVFMPLKFAAHGRRGSDKWQFTIDSSDDDDEGVLYSSEEGLEFSREGEMGLNDVEPKQSKKKSRPRKKRGSFHAKPWSFPNMSERKVRFDPSLDIHIIDRVEPDEYASVYYCVHELQKMADQYKQEEKDELNRSRLARLRLDD